MNLKVVRYKGKTNEKGLSLCEDVKDKNTQVLFRMRRNLKKMS
jgi:hypothetical protein